MELNDPITGKPPAEVPLERSPLVKVIAQIRFPMVAAVGRQEFMSPFQEAIRKTYPVLRPEKGQSIVLQPGAAPLIQSEAVWRFSDIEGAWRVGLSPTFLSLEATKYESRTGFADRLKEIVRALERYVQPAMVDRLGIRYINRLTGEDLKELSLLIRPEVRGIVNALPNLQHALTESAFSLERYQLMARWGLLPADQTPEPGIEVISENSWVLDLDMFTTQSFAFDTKVVINESLHFMERLYSLFRWMVTDEFLKRRGGKV